jgi:hypothetical protein
MTVGDLIDELAKCDADAPVFNAAGVEFDEVIEEKGEVTIFCETDEDEDATGGFEEVIDIKARHVK